MKSKSHSESFEEFFAEMEKDPRYWSNIVKYRFVSLVFETLESKKITQDGLANRLGIKFHRLKDILDAETDIQIADMVKIAFALGKRIKITFVPIKTNQKNENQKRS